MRPSHPSTHPCPCDSGLDYAACCGRWHAGPLHFEPGLRWLSLEVRSHESAGDTATVTFVARSKLGGRAQRLRETSRFVREGGRWWHEEGEVKG